MNLEIAVWGLCAWFGLIGVGLLIVLALDLLGFLYVDPNK